MFEGHPSGRAVHGGRFKRFLWEGEETGQKNHGTKGRPFPDIDDDQRRESQFAASQYLYYLLQENVQDIAQNYGFRPANPSVPLSTDVFSEKNGVAYEINVPTYRPMSGESMENLFTIWPDVKNPGV